MIDETKKLVHLNPQAENGFNHIIPIEDMFDICFETHLKIGHGMRNRMEYELKPY